MLKLKDKIMVIMTDEKFTVIYNELLSVLRKYSRIEYVNRVELLNKTIITEDGLCLECSFLTTYHKPRTINIT